MILLLNLLEVNLKTSKIFYCVVILIENHKKLRKQIVSRWLWWDIRANNTKLNVISEIFSLFPKWKKQKNTSCSLQFKVGLSFLFVVGCHFWNLEGNTKDKKKRRMVILIMENVYIYSPLKRIGDTNSHTSKGQILKK